MTFFALFLCALCAPAPDTLRLTMLQQLALARDPRVEQFALHASAVALRLRNVAAERLPRVTLRGDVARQSEVTSIPVTLPGGAAPPAPPKDRFQSVLDVGQLVYDGGVLSRRERLERARLAETETALHTELYALRGEVNEAYFSALLVQERLGQIDQLVLDLEARHAFVTGRVEGGVALRSQAAELEVELLRARQERATASARRQAALEVLSSLTGRAISGADVLTVPAVENPTGVRALTRPEYARFQAARDRLEREADVRAAQRHARVSAIGQLGYGRPGFDPFSRDLHVFWLAGVRVDWDVWDWGTNERDRAAIALQQQVVRTEEAAFTERVQRSTADDTQEIERLAATLGADARIVELRTEIERESRHRLEEGVLSAADYVDARTDVFEARVALETHRVELARARARHRIALGLPLE